MKNCKSETKTETKTMEKPIETKEKYMKMTPKAKKLAKKYKWLIIFLGKETM